MVLQSTLSGLHMEPVGENPNEGPYPIKSRPKSIKFNLHPIAPPQFSYIQIPPITTPSPSPTTPTRWNLPNEEERKTREKVNTPYDDGILKISTLEQNSNHHPSEWLNATDKMVIRPSIGPFSIQKANGTNNNNSLPIITTEEIFSSISLNDPPPEYQNESKSKKFVKRTNKFREGFKKMFIKSKQSNSCSKSKVASRMSILGKPLPQTRSKPLSFLHERIQVYKFLQKPSGVIAVTYHSIVAFFIIISLMFFAFTTVPDLEWWSIICLCVFDYLILSILVTEFVLLCWASPCIGKYQGFKGALRFVFCSPFRLLDLLVIGISAVICWTHWLPPFQQYLIWLRCGQVVQILRLENRFKPWRVFSSMFRIQRQAILITAYMCFLVLIVMAYIVYYCEKDAPDTAFTNIPNAVYWGIITVCSIGYGDIAPTTTAGRIICGIFAIIGMILYAVPPGIIATGLALKIQESNRQKHFNQQRVPAAWLIQCAWRCYTASPNSTSNVTWNQYFLRFQQSPENENTRTGMHRSWTYFNLRSANVDLPENDEFFGGNSNLALKQLTPVQKNCIRFIRALKFAAARKRLRNAFRPYDIKDVMQQYTEGHSDVVGRVRYMQNRIYTLEDSMLHLVQLLELMQNVHADKMDRLEHSFGCLEKLVNSTILYNRSDCFHKTHDHHYYNHQTTFMNHNKRKRSHCEDNDNDTFA